ncbi:MAG: hypothetical protein U0R44_00825 [Candidatus Micrarchaeia archaeon]
MDGAIRRMVGRTADIAEAERIAEGYRLQGFQTEIVRRSQGGIAFYEVWAEKEPDIRS